MNLKRLLIFLLGIYFYSTDTYSQGLYSCGFSEAQKELRNSENSFQNNQLQPNVEYSSSLEKDGDTYVIPVVFHVLNLVGEPIVSDQQIHDALSILNKDFSHTNVDTSEVLSQFKPLVANAKIRFELAKIAPNGRCFSGITRSRTKDPTVKGYSQAFFASHHNDVFQGIWPHDQYLNIFVLSTIKPNTFGYTYVPMGTNVQNLYNMANNSIYMLHSFVGSIGTSTPADSRVLTHEVGHWLNLQHIWGEGNHGTCGSDFVDDTPQTSGAVGCNLNQKTCDQTLDNIQNYMDYSHCSKHFTRGQIERMRSCLTSATGGRNSIWTDVNLMRVGVIGNSNDCMHTLSSQYLEICEGMSNSYKVTSFTDSIIGYQWIFEGGTPANSNEANPTILYHDPGSFDVKVYINTFSGSKLIHFKDYIVVDALREAHDLPVVSGFEQAVFPPIDWTLSNPTSDTRWKHSTSEGVTPSIGNSAVIDFYRYSSTTYTEDIRLPVVNIPTKDFIILSFDVAYKSQFSDVYDFLEILVSPECGANFVPVFVKGGADLETESPHPSPYLDPTYWRRESVLLNEFKSKAYVRIKFRGVNGFGNFLYLDNINLRDQTYNDIGVEHVEEGQLTIFPNPFEQEFSIQSDDAIQAVRVVDQFGRSVFERNYTQVKELDLNMETPSNGTYFLFVTTERGTFVQKLIKM